MGEGFCNTYKFRQGVCSQLQGATGRKADHSIAILLTASFASGIDVEYKKSQLVT